MVSQNYKVQQHDAWIELRQVRRDEVDFCVMMRRPNGHGMDARVVNISTHGFMARADGTFQQGEHVVIDLPAVGERLAKVAWALGGRVGGQFIVPIEARRYSELLAAAASRPRLRWPA